MTPILFFTCFNVRSVQMESSILYFHRKGYPVFFLTTCEKGAIHAELERQGIYTAAVDIRSTFKALYYLRLVRALLGFCKTHRIRFVHSHLQIPNLVSCMARFFMKAQVFNVRHNSDVVQLSGSRKEKWIDKLVNRLSKHIIAISDKVKEQLIRNEGVKPSKIHRINNGYDFGAYEALSAGADGYLSIRRQYACDLLVVSPGRLIPTKRHELGIEAIKALKTKGFSAKLLILGEGPLEAELRALIGQQGLTAEVFLLGYQPAISDYLKAADAVVLLSESEASNNAVKEAGYFEKPVVVCENVGDFNDYIRGGINGFLLPKQNPLHDCVAALEQLCASKTRRHELGTRLKETVLKQFDIEQVGKAYETLQAELSKAS